MLWCFNDERFVLMRYLDFQNVLGKIPGLTTQACNYVKTRNSVSGS